MSSFRELCKEHARAAICIRFSLRPSFTGPWGEFRQVENISPVMFPWWKMRSTAVELRLCIDLHTESIYMLRVLRFCSASPCAKAASSHVKKRRLNVQPWCIIHSWIKYKRRLTHKQTTMTTVMMMRMRMRMEPKPKSYPVKCGHFGQDTTWDYSNTRNHALAPIARFRNLDTIPSFLSSVQRIVQRSKRRTWTVYDSTHA